MMPWKGGLPLTSTVVEVFNALHGEAREKAIATGNYDEIVRAQKREPGEDEDYHLATQA